MATLIDIDVYSRLDSKDKTITQHSQDKAISNAMVFFLSSAKGDFLFEPQRGGILKRIVFKLPTDDMLNTIRMQIKNELEKEFSKYATDIDVSLTYDYTVNTVEIQIFWQSILTNDENQVIFYNKSYKDVQVKKTEIPFEDDNLLAFVIVKKPEMGNTKLIKNSLTDLYEWGNYIFTNFNEDSENFLEIESICNGV